MPMAHVPAVTLTPVAYFPKGYFLENLAVRSDGSVLVSAMLTKELWYVPGPEPSLDGPPVLVHTFEHNVFSIVEVEPEIFIISLSDAYTTHESHLARIDLTGWAPGDPVSPEIIYTFDYRVRMLNGGCLFAPGVLLIADALAGLIWRIDLGPGAHSARARVWMEHPTMTPDLDNGLPPPPQPGINGIHYGPKTGYVYYTGLAQKVFMRIPADADTLDPAGAPEFVAAITDGDDFCLDEVAGFAYVARHRGNTLDRVPLAPGHGGEVRHLAGDPLNEELLGLSSVAWGRGPADPGRVAYITIDGGRTAPPPDGNIHNAALVRAELQPAHKPRTPAWEKLGEHSSKKGATMPTTTTSLGGRLPLAQRPALTGAKLKLFDRLIAEVVPWAQGLGFLAQSADGALIGPFNPLLESPEISDSFWDWQLAEGKHTTLSDRERQVVILAVGAVWRASYELYSHSAAARTAGLSPGQADTLAGGEMPDQLSTREQCAWRFARELTAERRIQQPLYDDAAELFGTHGISDMVHLIGAYQTVCGILNAFNIPIPEGT